jgi:far upstream element-binding protein
MRAQYGVGTTKTVECPKSVVGRVIGKGGETIKGLQKQFGTSVQVCGWMGVLVVSRR